MRGVSLSLALGLGACAASSPTETGAPMADAGCEEVPLLTWENFGAGFLIENCQSCHASTNPDRRGAPAGVVFDSLEQTLAHRSTILARATGASPSMPPQGGVSDDDRERLRIWLTCWE